MKIFVDENIPLMTVATQSVWHDEFRLSDR